MKKTTVLIIIMLIIQFGFIFTPFLPNFIPETPTSRDEVNILVVVIAAQLALITLLFTVVQVKQDLDRAVFENELKEKLPAAHIKQVRDTEFYPHFLYSAQQSKNCVYITYLGPQPPNPHDRVKMRYYKNMNSLIKRHSSVHFRRIIRSTTANDPWIKSLLQQLKGHANAHIRLIEDSDVQEMPLALSVQLIDDRQVWLVALKAHEGQGEPRDLYIEHIDVSQSMHRYYDRLWEKSAKLLEGGHIVEPAFKR